MVTSALDLAVRAGCSPIVFAGLDLGVHARPARTAATRRSTTAGRGRWPRASPRGPVGGCIEAPRPIVMERAIEGGDTPTAAHLVTFRDWIRDYATARPHLRFVNGTGAGILHGAGIDVEGLSDLTSAMPRRADAGHHRDHAGASGTVPLRRPRKPTSCRASPAHRLSISSRGIQCRRQRRNGRLRRVGGSDRRVARPGPRHRRRNGGWAPAIRQGRRRAHHSGYPMPRAALRALDPGHRETFDDIGQPDPARARECLGVALDALRNVLLQDLRCDAGGHVPRSPGGCVGRRPGRGPGRLAARRSPARRDCHRRTARGAPERRVADKARRPALRILQGARRSSRRSHRRRDRRRTRAPVPSIDAGLDSLVWQWARVAAAALDTDAAIGRFISCLRASRPLPLPSPRTGAGLKVWLASAGPDAQPAGVPVLPFLHDRAVMRASTGLLTLDPASLPESSAAAPDSVRLSPVRATRVLEAGCGSPAHTPGALVGHARTGRPHRLWPSRHAASPPA